MACDVCGGTARFAIQYRPSSQSVYYYCGPHAAPIIERHRREQHLYELRLAS